MEIHKSVRDAAIKHHLNVGRDHNGYYYIAVPGLQKVSWPHSYKTTAKSGLVLIARELRLRKSRTMATVR